MTDATGLDGPRLPPAGGGAAKQLVVLLHGYGADGQDLIGLAPYFADILPDAAFVAPNAPERCEMSPFGYQWFSIQQEGDGARLAAIRASASLVDRFIDAELAALGLTADRLALVGFSQGTMMSLFVGPRRGERIAGILGYSGRLEGGELLADEARSKPPVTLLHGDSDEVVPFDRLSHAEQGLKAHGFEVATHRRPGLGHSIDPEGIEIGRRFLSGVLL